MLLSVWDRRRLGVPEEQASVHFGPVGSAARSPARYLFLSGRPAFELSRWCGTCPFLFERKEGANGTLSAARESLKELERPFDIADDHLFGTFSPLLPQGEYLPLLLEVQPELDAPHDERDYFTHEQVATWGVDSFWGLPENPRSYYYRTFETPVDSQGHLYEFVVPMVPPGWNDPERVEYYLGLVRNGVTPTAVALSTLDVCQPATDDESTDYYVHWGLSHFLLDGHHKLAAAARSGGPVQLLALVSVDGGLASSEDVARLPELLARPRADRKTEHWLRPEIRRE